MSRACLGLDIGSSYIKLVELRRKGRNSYQLISANKISTPDNSFARFKILDESLLTNAIHRLLVNADTKVERVVLGLNSSDVTIRKITYPKMSRKELDRVLEFELEDIFKLPEGVENLSYSYDVIEETDNEMVVLIAGCSKELIDPYLKVLRRAGLVPFIIDIGAFALPRVNDSTLRSCYVDLGQSQTVIYIELAGVYKVYRILPTGGITITQGIMDAFETSEARAENLKLSHDIDYLLVEGDGQKGLLRATVQQYVAGILQTLDYLRTQYRSSSIQEVLDQVVLCGGNAHIKGIDRLLRQELGIDVVLLDPYTRLEIGDKQPLADENGLYSTATGLALRGLEAP